MIHWLSANKFIQKGSPHPDCLVNYSSTCTLPGNTAATSDSTGITRLEFLATPRNNRWDHPALPQTRQHFAWHSFAFRSLNDRRIHLLCTYALRLVSPVLSWILRCSKCSRYSRPLLSKDPEQHLLHKLCVETNSSVSCALRRTAPQTMR